MAGLVNFAQLFLIILIFAPGLYTYKVPKAKIKVFYPKGFEVSIPDEEGITLFAFHGKLNEEMEGLEAGRWSRDILKPKNNRWIFSEHNTQLKLGDTLYYWTYVILNGLGYREDNGKYVVQEYFNKTSTQNTDDPIAIATESPCITAATTVNGIPVPCKGKIIFQDHFQGDTLNNELWSVERRIPQGPDYEFNMYLNDVPDVLQVRNGKVTIRPKPTNKHYSEIILRKTFSLGSTCTGKVDSEECVFHPKTQNKINPLITARIKMKDKFSFKYGRVEVKAKMPGAMWVFPQLWLEPTKLIYGERQYHSGQMRIGHTTVNGEEINLRGGLILNAQEPWRSLKMCQFENNDLNLSQDFHVYELNWTPDFIALAVDGHEYCRHTVANNNEAFSNLKISGEYLPNGDLLSAGSIWAPFDQEFYLTIGYGVGGNNDFKDGVWRVTKPWNNTDPRSKNKFWKQYASKTNWLQNADFDVDFVKIYAV
ncbi:gram-negative bacteria binding protein 3 [Cochliomyia hominivorax]